MKRKYSKKRGIYKKSKRRTIRRKMTRTRRKTKRKTRKKQRGGMKWWQAALALGLVGVAAAPAAAAGSVAAAGTAGVAGLGAMASGAQSARQRFGARQPAQDRQPLRRPGGHDPLTTAEAMRLLPGSADPPTVPGTTASWTKEDSEEEIAETARRIKAIEDPTERRDMERVLEAAQKDIKAALKRLQQARARGAPPDEIARLEGKFAELAIFTRYVYT